MVTGFLVLNFDMWTCSIELHCLLICLYWILNMVLLFVHSLIGLRNKVISEIGKKVGKMENGVVAILCLLSFVVLQVGCLDI